MLLKYAKFISTSNSKRRPLLLARLHYSFAAVSQQQSRSNLNVIDFFHPSLSSNLVRYSLNLGVSGYPKRGKVIEQPDDQTVYSSVQVGDDAYFKRHDALGVADGVGGWRTHKGNKDIYNKMCFIYLFIC